MSRTLARTGALLRFDARRDRIRATLWVLGLSIFVPYVMAAYSTLLSGDEMVSILSMLTNPTMKLFTGPGFGLGPETADSDLATQLIFAGVYWSYLLIFVALMNIFLVTRHTRQEEQTGRAEIVRANPVGRDSSLTAALLWVAICNIALGVLIAGGLIAFDSPVDSSILLAVATIAFGLFFAGLASLVAQVSSFASAANGIAGAVLGATYLARGLGDMSAPAGEHGSWLSWLSPFGWAQQTRAFHDDRWWPLLILVGFAVAFVMLAYGLQSRRDFGAGLIQVRRGKPAARAWVSSPLSVSWVILRSPVGWWSFGLLLAGLLYGSFTEAMVDAFADLPELFQELMGGADGAIVGYITLTVVMMRIMLAVLAVVLIGKLRAEEAEGRLEPLLATRFTPRMWLGNALIVATVAVSALAVGLGLLAGAFGTGVDGDTQWMVEGMAAGAAGIPSILLVLGLAAALYALSPRLLTLAWIPVVVGGVIEIFGEMLQLPDWTKALSPFGYTPEMPAQDFEVTPLLVQSAIVLGLAGFALWRMWLRNIPSQ